MDEQSFLTKYRPKTWDEVIGQDGIVQNLRTVLASPSKPHSFMLVGQPGVGKTSLARLIANDLECDNFDLTYVNVLESGLIDDVRNLVSSMAIRPFKGKAKVAIIDECQGLTTKAWSTFLIPTEDANQHAYYIFCTTDSSKIPEANLQRGLVYPLESVNSKLLTFYLKEYILPEENMTVIDGLVELVVKESKGSVRKALSLLLQLSTVKDLTEVNKLLYTIEDNKSVSSLAKLMISGSQNWKEFNTAINKLENDTDLSRIKHNLTSYISTVVSKTSDMDDLKSLLFALDVIDMLPAQGSSTEIIASLQLMAGRCIFK